MKTNFAAFCAAGGRRQDEGETAGPAALPEIPAAVLDEIETRAAPGPEPVETAAADKVSPGPNYGIEIPPDAHSAMLAAEAAFAPTVEQVKILKANAMAIAVAGETSAVRLKAIELLMSFAGRNALARSRGNSDEQARITQQSIFNTVVVARDATKSYEIPAR